MRSGFVFCNTPMPLCFRPVEQGRFRLYLRTDYVDALLALLEPLDTLWARLTRSTPVARGRSSVAMWRLPGREEGVVLRRYVHGGALGRLLGQRFWLSERPFVELALTERARESGVAVPLPLGVVVERLAWPTWRAAFLSVEVPGAEDMVHFCCRMAQEPPDVTAKEKRLVVREAARQVRSLHDAGIDHADLHLKNILLGHAREGSASVTLIDLDKARERDPREIGFRLGNLMRLARSVRKLRVAQAALGGMDRVRFLREYLRGFEDGERLKKLWAPALVRSGAWHEKWWAVSGAKRNLLGDRLPR